MAIRFGARLRRLIQADAHGLVASLEDRAMLLRQHLREAEFEIERKRARLAALADEERRLGEDADRVAERVAALDEDTALALREDKEELARFSIRKLLPLREELAALRGRIREIGDERERLAPLLAEQEQQFEELRARVRAELARPPAAGEDADPFAAPAVSDHDVEMELLRRRQAQGGTA